MSFKEPLKAGLVRDDARINPSKRPIMLKAVTTTDEAWICESLALIFRRMVDRAKVAGLDGQQYL